MAWWKKTLWTILALMGGCTGVTLLSLDRCHAVHALPATATDTTCDRREWFPEGRYTLTSRITEAEFNAFVAQLALELEPHRIDRSDRFPHSPSVQFVSNIYIAWAGWSGGKVTFEWRSF